MSEDAPPELSVVIPLYNGAAFVKERLHVLCDALESHGRSYEVIVVDDGSSDDSARLVREAGRPRVRLLSMPGNQGKFAALQVGMAECRGRCHLFTDADVPYDLEALPVMAASVLDAGHDLAIGDRNLPGSRYSEKLNPVRALATRIFTRVVRAFLTEGLPDTQCGLKAFRADAARGLFPMLRERGFAGDVELVYLAVKYRLSIQRVPVRLVFQGRSSVRPLRDALSMLKAIAALPRRFRAGDYASRELEALGGQGRGAADQSLRR